MGKEYFHRMNTEQFKQSFSQADLVMEEFRNAIIKKHEEAFRKNYVYFAKLKALYLQQLEEGKTIFRIRVYKENERQRKESYEIQCDLVDLGYRINLDLMEDKEKKQLLHDAVVLYRKNFFEIIKKRNKANNSRS